MWRAPHEPVVEVDGAEQHRMVLVTSFHARGQGEEEVPGAYLVPYTTEAGDGRCWSPAGGATGGRPARVWDSVTPG